MNRRALLTVLGAGLAGCSNNAGQQMETGASPTPTATQSPTASATATATETDTPTESPTATEEPTPKPAERAQKHIDAATGHLDTALAEWMGYGRDQNPQFVTAVTASTTDFSPSSIVDAAGAAKSELRKAESDATESQKQTITELKATAEFLKWLARAEAKLVAVYKPYRNMQGAYFENLDAGRAKAEASDAVQAADLARGVVGEAVSAADRLLDVGPSTFQQLTASAVRGKRDRIRYNLRAMDSMAKALPPAIDAVPYYQEGVTAYREERYASADGRFLEARERLKPAWDHISGLSAKWTLKAGIAREKCFVGHLNAAAKYAREAAQSNGDRQLAQKADDEIAALQNCNLQVTVEQFY